MLMMSIELQAGQEVKRVITPPNITEKVNIQTRLVSFCQEPLSEIALEKDRGSPRENRRQNRREDPSSDPVIFPGLFFGNML